MKLPVVIGSSTSSLFFVFFVFFCVCVFFAPTGYSVLAVGVADVDMTELRNIASKPSERHVFVVDSYDAFAKIQDNLITVICETVTSSKAVINISVKHYSLIYLQSEKKTLCWLRFCTLYRARSVHLQRYQEGPPLMYIQLIYCNKKCIKRDESHYLNPNLFFQPLTTSCHVLACPLIYKDGFTTPGKHTVLP